MTIEPTRPVSPQGSKEPARPVSPREAGSQGPSGTGLCGKRPGGTKPQPGTGLTSMELRCYAITVLAVVSIVSWRVITAGAAASQDPHPASIPDPPAISRRDPPAAPGQIDGGTPAASYTVPAGWHVVGWDPARPTPSRRTSGVVSPPAVVRAPVPAAPRVVRAPEPSAPRVVRVPAQSAATVVRAPAPRKKLVRAPASRRVRTRSS